MSDAYFWLSLTLLLVIAEVFTGTFYVLMLAAGALAGALAAVFGLNMAGQQLSAALCAIAATGFLWVWRKKFAFTRDDSADPLAIDIGQTVQVSAWQADGSAHVQYRGATWLARLAASEASTLTPDAALPAKLGRYTIVALVGNELRIAPQHAEHKAA